MNSIKIIGLMGITILISNVISFWFFSHQNKIYSVNLGRIMQTQMMIAGRMSATGINKSTWMVTIKDTSENIRQTIKSIAGNHTVIVSPAAIQGTIDITDKVLKLLSLPTNLPTTAVTQTDVIPSLIPKIVEKDAMTNKKAKPQSSWLLP